MTLVLLGAVAYDPKVVSIWEGFKRYFQQQGLSFDYVLYSNYERQVEALLDGTINVAWNSPLAWVRSRRMACARQLRRHLIDTGARSAWMMELAADRGPLKLGEGEAHAIRYQIEANCGLS